MNKKVLNKSDLELEWEWEELVSYARQSIQDVAKRERKSVRSAMTQHIPNVEQSGVYRFLRNRGYGCTVRYLLKLAPLIQANDNHDVHFVDMLNAFISDVNTTVRSLMEIYSKRALANKLDIDRRTIDKICGTGLITTNSLTKITHNLDAVIRQMTGSDYTVFEATKSIIEPAFKLGM